MEDSSGNPPRILLVEGRDDEQVVQSICQRTGHSLEFSIAKKDGVDSLLKGISVEAKASGRKAMGILVDANDDPDGRWQAIKNRLKSADIDPPQQLEQTGAIFGERPRVGVWLMPDNESPGALEDFVADMIPEDDPVWPLAAKFIESVPLDSLRSSASKANLYAWLATRRRPGQMGTAIVAGDLRTDSAAVRQFISWLENLFVD